MSDIEALESRILAALDRLGDSVARLPAPEALAAAGTAAAEAPPQPEPAPAPVQAQADDQSGRIAELEAALAEERTVTAQLEERVKALKARQDETIDRLRGQIEDMRRHNATAQDAADRLRQANADLRDLNARMREKLSEQTAEPHLINKAMMAELESLRATRAADRAEVEAVIRELRPLLQEGAE